MNKVMRDMVPSKQKPPLRESLPVDREYERPAPKRRTAAPAPEPIAEKEEDYGDSHFAPIDEPRHRSLNRASKRSHVIKTDGVLGKRTVRPWFFALIAIICLGVLIFAFSLVYARATVAVIPATIDIPVSGTYSAYANSAASGTIAYKVIQTTGKQTQSIPATTGPVVTNYARGAVVLYNNYSVATQKIVAGTRLASGNGLIYTTNTTVIIPGLSSKGVAGSVAVNVTAAAGGSSYNIPVSSLIPNPSYGDFTIVAYKGTAKYTGFYARLNPLGAGITGGSSGHQIVTSTSSVTAANQVMQAALQKNLLAQAQTIVPAGYILFNNGGYSINYTPIAASTTSSTTAVVGMQATLYGILFKKTDLAQAIAPTQYNSNFDPQDLDTAQFTITNTQTFSPTNGATLNFNLKGTLNLVGLIATSTLARQLTGVSLSQSTTVFKGYSTIATAHVTIVPFWKHSFPGSPSRINVVIQPN